MADYHSAPPLLHLQPMFLSSPSLIRPFFFLSFFFLLLGNLSLSISFVSWSFFDRRQSLCYVCFLYNSLYLHVCIGLFFFKKTRFGFGAILSFLSSIVDDNYSIKLFMDIKGETRDWKPENGNL